MADINIQRTRVIEKIQERLDNPQPLLEEWRDILISDVRRNFDNQGIEGMSWEPLSPATRKRYNPDPDEILIDSQRLYNSIDGAFGDNSVFAGPSFNQEYELIHQFGGRSGPGLQTIIPPRPYVSISSDGLNKIRESYISYWFNFD